MTHERAQAPGDGERSTTTLWLGAAAIYVYLCLPRIYVELTSDLAPGPLSGHLLATALLWLAMLAAREALAHFSPGLANGLLLAGVALLFLLRALEAGLLVSFGVRLGAMVLVHAGFEAARVGVADYPGLIALGAGVLAAGCAGAAWWIWRSSPPRDAAPSPSRSVLVCAIALLGLAAVGSSARATLSVSALVSAVQDYRGEVSSGVLDFTQHELDVLADLGIVLDEAHRQPKIASGPEPRLNLIFVWLEAWQANFIAAGDSPFEGLTPNLDRWLARMSWVKNAYNAVTPTIMGMTATLCGVMPPDRPAYAEGRDYRTLRCFTDLLHDDGYRQVFMGAAHKTFSAKNVLLEQHGYDEVYGHEEFGKIPKYRLGNRNTWGIHDHDLFVEAVMKLEELREDPPFHLSLLTINSHKPGYPSPNCPTYEPGNRTLNGIHCTDYALGPFLDAVERMGLLENTAIVLVGDHMAFPIPDTVEDLGAEVSNNYFGNVFMAIYSPIHDLPPVIDTYTHSPDVAPTVMDLLGFELASPFVFGKSLLRDRADYPHLVGPETEIFEGEFHPKKRKYLASEHCTARMLSVTRLEDANRLQSPCERYRMVVRVDRWLREGERD